MKYGRDSLGHTWQFKVFPALIGAAIGGLVLHPFAMVVYRTLMVDKPLSSYAEPFMSAIHSFAPHMWPMTFFNAVLGAFFGLVMGGILKANHQLAKQQLETAEHKAAQETLKDITLTVAHYVRNANSLIGGYTSRLMEKPQPHEEILRQLAIVKNASMKIEAVVAALQTLDAGDGREEVGRTQMHMFDIRDALKKSQLDNEAIAAEMNGVRREPSRGTYRRS